MPNHCETDLTILGPISILDEVQGKFFTENGELNCDAVIPYPDEYKELDRIAHEYEKAHPGDWAGRPKDGFNSGGYTWCCNNWGTKWGTYNGQGMKRTKNRLFVSFNSAWAPPTPVIEKLAADYPQLTFIAKSYEQGCAFKLDYKLKNGDYIRKDEHDYHGNRGG